MNVYLIYYLNVERRIKLDLVMFIDFEVDVDDRWLCMVVYEEFLIII